MKIKFLSFLLIALSTLLSASTPCSEVHLSERPLTLAELVDIGLKNNPETRQGWWNAQRAAAALGISKSAYYPKANIVGTATHGRTFKFINGPDTTYTIVGADLVLSMMLYDFGRTSADVRAARMGLLAANWQTDWTLQKVMVRILENAYNTLHAQETLKASTTSRDDAIEMAEMTKELNRAGLRPISDVYTSDSTVAQMQMNATLHEAMLEIQKGKLAASLGLSADTCLSIAPLDDLPPPETCDLDSLIALAKQQRADMMAKQARLLESLARMDKAEAAYRPKVSLTGYGGADHAFHDKAKAAHYDIALNIDIPLFTGFETAYQNRLAFADAQMSSTELAQLELDIALEVLTYSKTFQAAQTMLTYANDNLKSAALAYESTVERYKAGKDGISEVSNALNQLANARLRYSDVKTRYHVSLANLAYATGTLAPYSEETLCE